MAKNWTDSAVLHISVIALLGLSGQSLRAQSPTARIVTAANMFLSILNDKQRQSVVYGFPMTSSSGLGGLISRSVWSPAAASALKR